MCCPRGCSLHSRGYFKHGSVSFCTTHPPPPVREQRAAASFYGVTMKERANDLLKRHPRSKVAMILGIDKSELAALVPLPVPPPLTPSIEGEGPAQQARRLYDAGMTPRNIAAHMGMEYEKLRKYLHPERRARKLIAKGKSVEYIADVCKLPESQVKALFNERISKQPRTFDACR
jgi:hypothetical protein